MNASTLSPIATRFAWKEYRTLRGFWVAALALGALVQWFGYAVHDQPPGTSWPTALFATALATAALYAVGVAATTFSMEHEDETYAFLTGLPTRYLPVFAGKMLFALASALALVITLTFFGCLLTGGELADRAGAAIALGTFGFVIVEALVWGTFFSLLLRQPLLAALLAIGAVSMSLSWLTTTFVEGNLSSLSADSYLAVLPHRAALVFIVFLIDIFLARRWLAFDIRRGANAADTSNPAATDAFRRFTRMITSPLAKVASQFDRSVISHLLWQAWRQSWKPMLTMSIIVPLVCLSVGLIAGLDVRPRILRFNQFLLFPAVVAFVASALYWSVVFFADQRGHKYRFLAEHAAWPRYVWFTRLAVWSLPVALALVTAAALTASGVLDLVSYWRRQAEDLLRYNFSWDPRHIASQWYDFDAFGRALLLALWAALLGFALGQACSLFFRRALVAGFAALVLTIPLSIWGVAIWAWELAPMVFLLPIIIGLVAATWLRVPDWIVDRSTLSGWLKVLAAVALPLAFVAWRLPAARTISDSAQRYALGRINFSVDARLFEPTDDGQTFDISQIVNNIVASWVAQSDAEVTPEQQATADRLIRLSESVEWPKRLAGANPEADLTPAESAAYARRKVELNLPIIREATKLSRETYRFAVSEITFDKVIGLADLLKNAGQVATLDGDLDSALDYHLAALALWERSWASQPTYFIGPSYSPQQFQSKLVEWANANGQTSARIQRAIAELDSIYPPGSLSSRTPPPQLIATHRLLRDILMGEQPSHLLDKYGDFYDYSAVLANELPFERNRSLKILDFLTISEDARWRDIIWRTNQQQLQDWAKDTVKARGEDYIDDMGAALRRRVQNADAYSLGGYNASPAQFDDPPYSWLRTTPLLRMEVERLNPFGAWIASVVDTQIAAWGTRQQLALIAYRIDHDNYPDLLDALVPDYLPFVPIDPYSGRPFEYRPHGLDRELQGIPPGTPLLWSVGAGDAQPRLITVTGPPATQVDPAEEPVDTRRDVYELQPRERSIYYYLGPQVFRLPKSAAPGAGK